MTQDSPPFPPPLPILDTVVCVSIFLWSSQSLPFNTAFVPLIKELNLRDSRFQVTLKKKGIHTKSKWANKTVGDANYYITVPDCETFHTNLILFTPNATKLCDSRFSVNF